MNLQKLEDKHKLMLRYILLSILAFCTIFSDILIQQKNLDIELTISSIFIFLIIGLERNRISLLMITLLTLILFGINGFNIVTSIEALEIYFVWFLYKNNKKNIMVQVSLFWGVLALPLIFIATYVVNSRVSIESAVVILLIFFNRVFNALVGNVILDYIPLERIIGKTHGGTKTNTLSDLLIYVTVASLLVPIMIFYLSSNSRHQKQGFFIKLTLIF